MTTTPLKLFLRLPATRLKKNQNFIAVVVGGTGSGKSYACVGMAELLAKEFNLLFDTSNICFTPLEFINKVRNSPKGSVIIGDEFGTQMNARDFQSLSNRLLGYLMQTMRYKNHIVFLSVPDFTFIDKTARKLTHCLMLTSGIKKKEKLCGLKPYLMENNPMSGKIYYKFPTAKTNGKTYKLKNLWIPLASRKLIKEYEAKKFEFGEKLAKDIENDLTAKKEKKLPVKLKQTIEVIKKEPLIKLKDLSEKLNITPQRAGKLRTQAEEMLDVE